MFFFTELMYLAGHNLPNEGAIPVSIRVTIEMYANELNFVICEGFHSKKGSNPFWKTVLEYLKLKNENFENLVTCNLLVVLPNGTNARSIG